LRRRRSIAFEHIELNTVFDVFAQVPNVDYDHLENLLMEFLRRTEHGTQTSNAAADDSELHVAARRSPGSSGESDTGWRRA
jgi:hypothetical protein